MPFSLFTTSNTFGIYVLFWNSADGLLHQSYLEFILCSEIVFTAYYTSHIWNFYIVFWSNADGLLHQSYLEFTLFFRTVLTADCTSHIWDLYCILRQCWRLTYNKITYIILFMGSNKSTTPLQGGSTTSLRRLSLLYCATSRSIHSQFIDSLDPKISWIIWHFVLVCLSLLI